MQPTASKTNSTVPGSYALLVIETLKQSGMGSGTLERLLQDLQLNVQTLANPDTRVSLETLNTLLAAGLAFETPYRFAIRLGMLLKISSHGYVGFAAMTANTVRDALDLAQRFILLRIDFVSLRLETEGELCHLFFEDTVNLHPLREILVIVLFYAFWKMGEVVTGKPLFGDVDCSISKPLGYDEFSAVAPGHFNFDRPFNRMTFSASYLDQPLIMADPTALKLALEQCERELESLSREQTFLQRARDLLYSEATGFLSAEQLADRLHFSSRTLKRQLAAHNTSYSQMLDESRRRKAVIMLEQPSISIELIAEKLGYSDVANFSRAFKRWTGQSPNAYRKSRT